MKIELKNILWGGEQGISASLYSLKSRNYMRSSTFLKDSPHVQLLKLYQKIGKNLFESEEYKKTAYYHNIIECIQICGNYFNIKDPKDAVHQIRRFIDHYNGIPGPEIYHQSDESMPLVAQNAFSQLYEVIDGIHRLAIEYVKGVEDIECRISEQKTLTFLQQLVLGNSWTHGQQLLYQPIDAPEFEYFTLVRKCSDRFALMKRFLASCDLDVKGKKYLDLGCSYGYFMSQMKTLGMLSYGVDNCANSIMLGQICYHMPKENFSCNNVERFFEVNEEKYEIVSLLSVLHHFLLNRGKLTAEELIKKVDAITKCVLFIDSGQNHEEWFKDSLPDWDESAIINWIKENTTFDEVLSIGKDKDSVGVYAPNYRRSLIACIKH